MKSWCVRMTEGFYEDDVQELLDLAVDLGALALDCTQSDDKRHKYISPGLSPYTYKFFGVGIHGETCFHKYTYYYGEVMSFSAAKEYLEQLKINKTK